jgi:hypothetical protein
MFPFWAAFSFFTFQEPQLLSPTPLFTFACVVFKVEAGIATGACLLLGVSKAAWVVGLAEGHVGAALFFAHCVGSEAAGCHLVLVVFALVTFLACVVFKVEAGIATGACLLLGVSKAAWVVGLAEGHVGAALFFAHCVGSEAAGCHLVLVVFALVTFLACVVFKVEAGIATGACLLLGVSKAAWVVGLAEGHVGAALFFAHCVGSEAAGCHLVLVVFALVTFLACVVFKVEAGIATGACLLLGVSKAAWVVGLAEGHVGAALFFAHCVGSEAAGCHLVLVVFALVTFLACVVFKVEAGIATGACLLLGVSKAAWVVGLAEGHVGAALFFAHCVGSEAAGCHLVLVVFALVTFLACVVFKVEAGIATGACLLLGVSKAAWVVGLAEGHVGAALFFAHCVGSEAAGCHLVLVVFALVTFLACVVFKVEAGIATGACLLLGVSKAAWVVGLAEGHVGAALFFAHCVGSEAARCHLVLVVFALVTFLACVVFKVEAGIATGACLLLGVSKAAWVVGLAEGHVGAALFFAHCVGSEAAGCHLVLVVFALVTFLACVVFKVEAGIATGACLLLGVSKAAWVVGLAEGHVGAALFFAHCVGSEAAGCHLVLVVFALVTFLACVVFKVEAGIATGACLLLGVSKAAWVVGLAEGHVGAALFFAHCVGSEAAGCHLVLVVFALVTFLACVVFKVEAGIATGACLLLGVSKAAWVVGLAGGHVGAALARQREGFDIAVGRERIQVVVFSFSYHVGSVQTRRGGGGAGGVKGR